MTQLLVPLLTIVPIPYIAIDTIQIDFKANISASSSSVTSTSDSSETSAGGKTQASFGWGFFSVTAEFEAHYSSKKDSKASEESKYSVEYTMDVSVHAGQSDMPAGLATVLNILQSSITTANANGSFTIPENLTVTLSERAPQAVLSLPVTIIDQNGVFLPSGKDVQITIGTGLTALTVTPTNSIVKSGSNGVTTFTLTCDAVKGYTVPQNVPVTFTLKGYNNGTDLTGTANIQFIGTPIS